jgi:chemosensory pili system protein ChpA (sensor histidine kinase/response regulator)
MTGDQERSEMPGADRALRGGVLIVDDDAPIRNLLHQVFKRLGLATREARDGVEALSCIDEQLPELVMLDLMMPRMNGWQVLEHLRDNGILDHLPVIVLTAVGPVRAEGLKEFPIRAVLGKPFEIRELIETVQQILD